MPSATAIPGGRFVRLGETARRAVHLTVDGRPVTALEGDTLLVAVLANGGHLRHSEFGDGVRSGFCLMSACQDCWVRGAGGERWRACSTPVAEGMAVLTQLPEATWPRRD